MKRGLLLTNGQTLWRLQRYRTCQSRNNETRCVPGTDFEAVKSNTATLWSLGGEWRLPLEACLVRKEARKETKRKKYGVTYGAGSAAWSQSGTNWLCSSWRRSSGAGPSPSNYTHTHRNRNRQCVSGMLSTTGAFNDPYINPVHPTAEWTELPTAATCWYQTPCRETKLLRGRGKNKVYVCVCVCEGNIWNSMSARRDSGKANRRAYRAESSMGVFMCVRESSVVKSSIHLCVCVSAFSPCLFQYVSVCERERDCV